MFREVKSPAYGTGIATNLVSSEERQRYNYGGRVGLWAGTGGDKRKFFKKKPMYPPYESWQGPRNEYWTQTNLPDGVFPPQGKGRTKYVYDEIDYAEGIPKNLATMDYNIEGVSSKPYKIGELETYGGGDRQTKRGDIFGSGYTGQGTGEDTLKNKYSVDISDMSLEEARDIGRESDWWKMQKGDVFAQTHAGFGDEGEDLGYKYLSADTWVDDKGNLRSQKDLSDTGKMVMQEKFKKEQVDDPIVEEDKFINPNDETLKAGKGINFDDMPKPKFEETETLDIEGIVDKYYDKKGSLGAAQLGLAGQILKAGFQPKKDAMATVGDAMGQFGKDISEDKKAFKKLAATGEIQRELYRMSRAEEGKQDRETLEYKNKLTKWLKDNGVEEDEISDIENYVSIYGWDENKRGAMTGHQHQDLIATFDEDFATKSIVISPTTTGIGKDKVTSLTEFDQTQLNDADEGDVIIIGKDIFVKDSSAPGKMRKTNYTQLKLSKNKKPKKKDKLLSAAGI